MKTQPSQSPNGEVARHKPRSSEKVRSLQLRCKARAMRWLIPTWGVGGLFFLSFFPFFLSAQEVKFSFDKTNILLGEPIKMTIEAVLGSGQNSDLFSIDTLPHFEVLDQSKIDTAMQAGVVRLKQVVVITSWDSGSWQLPGVIRDGKAMQPVDIEVSYTNPWDPKQPYHDIKGIAPVKNPGRSTWWWYVIGLAVLIALFLLFFPEGKKDKTVSELDAAAYKKAMLALDKLQKDGSSSDNVKQYYTELINIFRTYIKGAKGIQSFSKTTDDLSIQLQALKMPQSDYNNLVQTLRLSDLVKFAQYKPDGNTNNNAFNTIKESINTIERRNAV
jgi:hypothetical protein